MTDRHHCCRCGRCCIELAVVIVDNPAAVEQWGDPFMGCNIQFKPAGVRCQHLTEEIPGKFACGEVDNLTMCEAAMLQDGKFHPVER